MRDTTQPSNLESRLAFMQLDKSGLEAIRSLQPIIEQELGAALDKFYAQVRGTPETAKFFADERHMVRAKGAQSKHWNSISHGKLDESYARSVHTIGLTHARIGLPPRWYVGGYALIADHLIQAVITAHGTRSLWMRKDMRPDALAHSLGSLVKAILLDMDIAISVYIDEGVAARNRSEQLRANEQRDVNEALNEAVGHLAKKNLTYRLTAALPDAYAGLQDNFNSAVAALQEALGEVDESAATMTIGASEITAGADELSRRTEQQAASLEQTAAALDEITATVKKASEGAQRARDVVELAKADAEASGVVVQRTISAMGGISKSAQEINQIIGVIDEIAFQTNLLALNAGVEAARAGEAGRGFAVVASEVRALAQRSADAAKQIKALIVNSSGQVSEGVALVAQTGKALDKIIAEVSEINTVVAEIASGAQEQATGLQQVNTAINQMDQTTQQNASMVEEATAASHTLAQEAMELSRLVQQFKVRTQEAAAPSRGTASRRPAYRAA